uniref:EF-hand domain-containing protein n=1 Tax=Globodera rostochiensis TaxID=31243 RepID=A0A914HY84_GLORO
MGQRASSLPHDEIAGIAQETGFSRNQILSLHERYLQLGGGRESLVRHDLQISEMEQNPFQHRVIEAFFLGENEINFRRFIGVLAALRPDAPRVKKLKLGFTLIDTDVDGYLTRNDLEAVVDCIVSDVAGEQRDSLVDRLMAEADADKDGKITFEKYCKALEQFDIVWRLSMRF